MAQRFSRVAQRVGDHIAASRMRGQGVAEDADDALVLLRSGERLCPSSKRGTASPLREMRGSSSLNPIAPGAFH
jgi:hypothetical protein